MGSVVIQQVSKRFGSVTVLEGLNLDIEEGEFLVLVGPSGCGKSTLLRMIAGLEAVTSGSIIIGGRDVTWIAPKDREIAMVFQSYALYPHMTVKENMSFGLRLTKTPKAEIESRVAEAAKMLKIENLLDRRPRELSGGQRQRVAMGRAIVRHPILYLFDEPLSNLDAQLRTSMRAEIKRMHLKEKKTVIYVTHDQVEALTLADRIVVMDKGEVKQIGTASQLYDFPESIFVASFIGSPSMTLINGRVDAARSDLIWIDTERESQAFPLPSSWKGWIPPKNGKVKVGLRPEAFTLDYDNSAAHLDIEVGFVETYGSESYVIGELEGQAVTARCSSTWSEKSEGTVRFGIDLNQIHVFDQADGRSLRP